MTAPHPAPTSYPIPGTTLTAKFLGPTSSGFSPIFYAHSEGSAAMGSVNAGNSSQLYVGGGGINGAFCAVLDRIQDTSKYAPRHVALFNQAASGGNSDETYADDNPIGYSHVAPAQVGTTEHWYDGAVFIDVFGKGLQPDRNPHNTAMVYVAPPYGPNYDSDESFLAAIEQTAGHVAKCVSAFNRSAEQPASTLTPLRVLRLSLYSSNLYNRTPKVSLDLIALAIYDGLMNVLKADDGGLKTLEFPVAHHEFSAVEKKLQG